MVNVDKISFEYPFEIEKNSELCNRHVSDFAIACGCHTKKRGLLYYGDYLFKCTPASNQYVTYDDNGDIGIKYDSGLDYVAFPGIVVAIYGDDVKDFTEAPLRRSELTVELGEYPQGYVCGSLETTLNMGINSNSLKKTGRTFTTATGSNDYEPVILDEYEYEGDKYVQMTIAGLYEYNSYNLKDRLYVTMNNGKKLARGSKAWFKVEPIIWTSLNKCLLSQDIIMSGVNAFLCYGDKEAPIYKQLDAFKNDFQYSPLVKEETSYEDDEIEVLLTKIKELISNMDEEPQKNIKDKVNELIDIYNTKLNNAKPKLDEDKGLSLETTDPLMIKSTLLMELESIVRSLSNQELNIKILSGMDTFLKSFDAPYKYTDTNDGFNEIYKNIYKESLICSLTTKSYFTKLLTDIISSYKIKFQQDVNNILKKGIVLTLDNKNLKDKYYKELENFLDRIKESKAIIDPYEKLDKATFPFSLKKEEDDDLAYTIYTIENLNNEMIPYRGNDYFNEFSDILRNNRAIIDEQIIKLLNNETDVIDYKKLEFNLRTQIQEFLVKMDIEYRIYLKTKDFSNDLFFAQRLLKNDDTNIDKPLYNIVKEILEVINELPKETRDILYFKTSHILSDDLNNDSTYQEAFNLLCGVLLDARLIYEKHKSYNKVTSKAKIIQKI